MSSVYSKNLLTLHNVNSGYLEADPGFTVVIRTITVFAAGPVAGGVAQLVDHATDATIWWTPLSPTSAGAYVIEPDCRLIIEGGGRVDLIADAGLGEGVDLSLNGYVLTP